MMRGGCGFTVMHLPRLIVCALDFLWSLHFLLSPGDSLRGDHRKLVAIESHTLTAHRNGLGGVTSMNLGSTYSYNCFLGTANECLDAWMLGYKKGE